MSRNKVPSDAALIDLIGGTSAVAKLFGIKAPSVSEWRDKGIPADKRMRVAALVERETAGKYTCEQICGSGASLTRVADAAWPWHPQGRPVLELVTELQAAAWPRRAASDHRVPHRRHSP